MEYSTDDNETTPSATISYRPSTAPTSHSSPSSIGRHPPICDKAAAASAAVGDSCQTRHDVTSSFFGADKGDDLAANSDSQSCDREAEQLSPSQPPVRPVMENGVARFYCHLCSFCGETREGLLGHLEGHYVHKCDQCDYTSRTEGRLKQHILRFHQQGRLSADQNPAPNSDEREASRSPDSLTAQPDAAANADERRSPSAAGSSSRTPTRHKVYRCKQCDFTATVKTEFWNHARTHIKEEKLLQCPKCPFVTEYKHHLEYHLRNHFGSKPFKCTKCNYACVNKSMLNSHMKSHTNIYQYRCADCTYATKYCHSLKLHLRKYNHNPASILNLDGTVDHDTSALLVMKRSGPKAGKPKERAAHAAHAAQTTHTGHTAEISISTPSQPVNSSSAIGNPSLPLPMARPSSFLPFWHLGTPVRAPASSPLLPFNMGNFFRGVFPPMMPQHRPPVSTPFAGGFYDPAGVAPHATGSLPNNDPSLTRPNNVSQNLSANGFNMAGLLANSMMQHKVGLTIPNADVSSLWTRGISSGSDDNGAVLSQMDTSESDEKSHTGSMTPNPDANMNNTNSDNPLDLSKSASFGSSVTVPTASAKKRLRKGKAHKLEDLCLKLQERLDAAQSDKPPGTARLTRNDSSGSNNSGGVIINNNNNNSAVEKLTDLNAEFREEEGWGSGKRKLKSELNNNDTLPQQLGLTEKRTSLSRGGQEQIEGTNPPTMETSPQERHVCFHCDIAFKNWIMYTVHMGYHDQRNPFRCKECGESFKDKISFFLHIGRQAHI